MELPRRFNDLQLEQIIEEATIYMCACPGQVAVQLRSLRELFRYQGNCEVEPGNDVAVHQTIAAATVAAYAVMEDCLDQVLTWKLGTKPCCRCRKACAASDAS